MRSIAVKTALVTGGGVLAAAALAAPAVAGATATPAVERSVPGMALMHQQMMHLNGQMQQMHDRVMQQSSGMSRMHEQMIEDDAARPTTADTQC